MQQNLFDDFADFCNRFELYDITHSQYFSEAMTHSSVSKQKNYERLEFFGDTILNFCISRMLFERFLHDTEGVLSEKKSLLISRNVCAKVAKDIHIDKFVKTHPQTAKLVGHCLADIMESFICVIYLEFGIDKTYEVISCLFELYLTSTRQYKDAKMELQEYTQKKYGCLPKYTLINKTGAENAPTFFVQVRVGKYVAEGQGSRKKLAEEDAAERMLGEIYHQ
ncbi:MAG: ribonuclease III [Rickettsiales bacterium]|nr:ribonuclease III [Rickettsiales bacterium]